MDAQVRISLTVPEASLLLERAGAQPGAPAADTVLGCPLLAVRQGRVSFTHEQFGRFLTAEHLVIDSTDPAALADGLNDPRHTERCTGQITTSSVTTSRCANGSWLRRATRRHPPRPFAVAL